jgi:hypothetical protein
MMQSIPRRLSLWKIRIETSEPMAVRLKLLCIPLLIAGFSGFTVRSVRADTIPGWDPGLVCTYSAFRETPELCPNAGPAPTRAAYWENGLLPRQPLPAIPLNPDLKKLDRWYAAVSKDRRLSLYASPEDAVANNPSRFIEPGYVWISLIDVIVRDEGTILMTGDWKDYVWAEDVSQRDYIQVQFTGYEFADTPARPFGWIVEYQGLRPSRSPGGPPDPKAPLLKGYDPVEVFDSQDAGGLAWYMIGINQWVDQKKVGLVFPAAGLPEGIPAGAKWISINLFEQTLAAYEGTRLVFATLTASGLPGWWTRPGLFQIYEKHDLQTMQGVFEADRSDLYYVGDVPWVMYYDRKRAIHGEYWHNKLGGRHSHGCVNIPVADSRWLYDWAPEGTWVWVYDPSNETPTDEASYANDAGI